RGGVPRERASYAGLPGHRDDASLVFSEAQPPEAAKLVQLKTFSAAEFMQPLGRLSTRCAVAGNELSVHRHRRLTDADRADLLRFDQTNRIAALQHLRKGGGGHPARSAAADNDNVLETRVVHRASRYRADAGLRRRRLLHANAACATCPSALPLRI